MQYDVVFFFVQPRLRPCGSVTRRVHFLDMIDSVVTGLYVFNCVTLQRCITVLYIFVGTGCICVCFKTVMPSRAYCTVIILPCTPPPGLSCVCSNPGKLRRLRTVLYCTALRCSITVVGTQPYTVLYCAALYCAVNILRCSVLCYLYCIVLRIRCNYCITSPRINNKYSQRSAHRIKDARDQYVLYSRRAMQRTFQIAARHPKTQQYCTVQMHSTPKCSAESCGAAN